MTIDCSSIGRDNTEPQRKCKIDGNILDGTRSVIGYRHGERDGGPSVDARGSSAKRKRKIRGPFAIGDAHLRTGSPGLDRDRLRSRRKLLPSGNALLADFVVLVRGDAVEWPDTGGICGDFYGHADRLTGRIHRTRLKPHCGSSAGERPTDSILQDFGHFNAPGRRRGDGDVSRCVRIATGSGHVDSRSANGARGMELDGECFAGVTRKIVLGQIPPDRATGRRYVRHPIIRGAPGTVGQGIVEPEGNRDGNRWHSDRRRVGHGDGERDGRRGFVGDGCGIRGNRESELEITDRHRAGGRCHRLGNACDEPGCPGSQCVDAVREWFCIPIPGKGIGGISRDGCCVSEKLDAPGTSLRRRLQRYGIAVHHLPFRRLGQRDAEIAQVHRDGSGRDRLRLTRPRNSADGLGRERVTAVWHGGRVPAKLIRRARIGSDRRGAVAHIEFHDGRISLSGRLQTDRPVDRRIGERSGERDAQVADGEADRG